MRLFDRLLKTLIALALVVTSSFLCLDVYADDELSMQEIMDMSDEERLAYTQAYENALNVYATYTAN